MSTGGHQPRSASAVTRSFFELLAQLDVSQSEVSIKSGIHVNTFYGWRIGRAGATVPNMEAALAVLGFELCIRPLDPFDADPSNQPSQENNHV